jgi:hypothetical protein
MENKTKGTWIGGILWTLLAGLLIFGIGVAIGMYATHPLINIANISIHNNSATVNSYNGIPYRNNTSIGKYIPNYNGNKTTYTPNLLCFTAYNNTVGWSSPYNCVRVTP